MLGRKILVYRLTFFVNISFSRDIHKTNLSKAFNRALARNRSSLLYDPPKPKLSDTVKIMTKFSAHHSHLRTVLSDHWHLLTDHHTLNKYIKTTPELVLHKAISLQDRLTSSHYTTSTRSQWYLQVWAMPTVPLDS